MVLQFIFFLLQITKLNTMRKNKKKEIEIIYRTDLKNLNSKIRIHENDLKYSFEGNGSFYFLGIERLKGKFLNVYDAEEYSSKILEDKAETEKLLKIQKQLEALKKAVENDNTEIIEKK